MMKVRSRFAAAILSICLLYLNLGSVAMAGTLLPNGAQYFTDNNGLPLSAGCVYFYIPGTTTPKTTYQDSGQTVANTNPVQLDAAGRAIIYGTGTYRQVVKATGSNPALPCSPSGTQIWDQLTASTDSSTTIYAGASAGTPNAITVNAPAFSGTDGQVINYVSTNTNTGGATLNPSGFGNVQIMRDSATGPGALTGGELVATNSVSVIYDATAGIFHILSPITWPNTSGVPVGTIIAVGGFSAPTNYAFAYGQAISRTTFAPLLSTYTLVQTGSISSGSPTITGLSDTTQIGPLKPVEAIGIPIGARVLSCTSTTCTMNQNATATRSGSITFFAYENGDGTTTFNLPDLRGQGLAGRDNMGGVAGNVLQASTTLSTTNTSTTATVGSAANLAGGMSVVGNANVPAGTTIASISGSTVTLSAAATATQSNVATRFSSTPDAQGLGVSGGSFAKQLVTVEMPAHTHANTLTDPGHTHTIFSGSNGAGGSAGVTVGSGTFAINNTTVSSTTGITINNVSAGGGQVFQKVDPLRLINWAVRITP